MNQLAYALWLTLLASCASHPNPAPDSLRWLTYPGGDGPGRGKHIVLIAADQEYRSEQSLPMLARILATHHGFDCTVLFAQNAVGLVDPTQKIRWEDKTVLHDIPGLEHLATADLMILFSRLITLPDAQIRHVIDYLDSGKPILAIRTANHGFLDNFPYVLNGQPVRFGEDVLGGTFREHHGNWHADSTRGILVEAQLDHPILRGVIDIWGPSDVYRTYPVAAEAATLSGCTRRRCRDDQEGLGRSSSWGPPALRIVACRDHSPAYGPMGGSLPAGCTALVYGQPLLGRQHDDAPNPEKEPLPVAWTKTWTGSTGKTARVFHLTMGSATDFQSADLRRLTVNAAYWCLLLDDRITPDRSVDYVGPYAPLDTGFDYARLGVVPKPVAAYR